MGTIVVGIDGSESSLEALRFAVDEARLRRDGLRLVHAWSAVPLAQQIVRHLARKHARGSQADHVVGGSVLLSTADLRRLEVRGPEGLGAVFEGDRITGRSSVRFGKTDRPGIYRVVGTDQTGATHDRDELAFVANLDPHGSDLTMAPPDALPKSGTGGGTPPTDNRRRVERCAGH